jgi:hypothetical protein
MCRRALVFALLSATMSGCAEPQAVRSTSWFERLRAPGFSKNLIRLDVALLERPAGDPFLDRELWNYTDEQTVPLEQKAALDDNGFRVGQLVGMPNSKLLALLTSERSCINARTRLVPPGRAARLLLGPTLPHTEFQVKENGQTTDVALDQAQFVVEVVPTPADNGKIRLRFAPKVQHGEKVPELRPAADGFDWIFERSLPTKQFPTLTWDVSLAVDEFIVVGANSELPQSLGDRAFIQLDRSRLVQRLLVLVLRSNGSGGNEVATLEDLARRSHGPPLAEQATVSAVRAHGP